MQLPPPRRRLLTRWLHQRVGRIMLQGLIAILPVAITLYLLLWLVSIGEAALGGLIRAFLPHDDEGVARYYVPGMGLLLGVALVFVIGLTVKTYVVRLAMGWEQRLFRRIPVVRSVYSAVRDMMYYMANAKRRQLGQVVIVTLPGTEIRVVGFRTREDADGLPDGLLDDDRVLVYLPMSYQIGGYTLALPRKLVQPVAMRFEDAMRLVLTGGVAIKPPDDESSPLTPEPTTPDLTPEPPPPTRAQPADPTA